MTVRIERRTVRIGGAQVSYLEAGRRPAASPTLLLIHGSGVSARCWHGQLATLGETCRVVAVDLPGHGASDAVRHATVERYAGALAALLDVVAAGSVVAVGHSLGAAVALSLAAGRLHAVRGLVLLSGCARLPRSETSADVLSWLPGAMRRLFFLSAARRLLFAPAAPARAVALGMQELSACRPQTVRLDVAAAMAMDLTGPARALRLPALVLCGRLDRLTPPALSAELAGLIPGARLALVDGAGHMLPMEAADVVNREILAFVASLSGQPPARPAGSSLRRLLGRLLRRLA